MSEYTLTYAENVEGWVSFYSFIPDYMIGMNNRLYSFKSGNLYLHNANSNRNFFYGTTYPSIVKTVLNDAPLENKLYKTLSLQGDDKWSAEVVTDLQISGYVEYNWFEKKEQVYFAYIRNDGSVPAIPDEYAFRSTSGIGRTISVDDVVISAIELNFSVSPPTYIDSLISVGDIVYFLEGASVTPSLAGEVTQVNVDLPNNLNQLVIDGTILDAQPITTQTPFIMFIKNSVAESHGLLGHYAVVTLENSSSNKIELFQLGSDVMKSYP
jgi:hypothetical protein